MLLHAWRNERYVGLVVPLLKSEARPEVHQGFRLNQLVPIEVDMLDYVQVTKRTR